MQGYILHFNRSRDEDLVVTVICRTGIYNLYRFYGARHSYINVGFKIDFEKEEQIEATIPRLRNVLHLPQKWIFEKERLFIWQNFIKLLHNHLRDLHELDAFYYEVIENFSVILQKQSPMRAFIDTYTKVLDFEGRLAYDETCYLCQGHIQSQQICLGRTFQTCHGYCIGQKPINAIKAKRFFTLKNSLHFDNEEVDLLYNCAKNGGF